MGKAIHYVLVLTIAFGCSLTVNSLDCFKCSTSQDHDCYFPNKTVHSCSVPNHDSDSDSGKIPMCITVEFKVLLTHTYMDSNQSEYEKRMTKPRFTRMCAMVPASEANKCITQNSPSKSYKQCTCDQDFCNDHSIQSTSKVLIYLLSIFITLGVLGAVTFFVYRKTGCNFS